MFQHRVFKTFLFAAAFMVLAVPAARAELSLAVVDVNQILSDSKAAKSIQNQVEAQRKKFLKEIEGEENKLREEQKKIEKQSADLSKEDLAKKAQEFETKRLEARKLLHGRKAALDNAYGEGMKVLSNTIYDVVEKISEEKGYDLVITRQNVVVGASSLDITAEVMDKLNAALPDVKLDIK